ncbi:MAG: CHAT domain-containing protein [Blastocatellia bacterium]|nr:CHAT domain-containing protein [Blastocatellia bacterium]
MTVPERAGSPVSKQVLQPGNPLTNTIKLNERQDFAVQLEAGRFCEVVIDPAPGLRLAVQTHGPDGNLLFLGHREKGRPGELPLWAYAEKPGTFLVTVEPDEENPQPGQYEIKIAVLRTGSEEDKNRAYAGLLFEKAEILRKKERKESSLEALALYEQGIAYWQAAREPYWEARLWNQIGMLSNRLGDLNKSKEANTRMLELARRQKDPMLEFSALGNLGVIYRNLGELHKAEELCRQSLTVVAQTNNPAFEGTALNNLANLYVLYGEPVKALETLSGSIPAHRRAKDNGKGEGIARTRLGQIYLSLGETQNALDHLNQALELLHGKLGSEAFEAQAESAIGFVFFTLGDVEKAQVQFERALALYRLIGNRSSEAVQLENLGQVAVRNKDIKKALDLFEQALAIHEAVKAPLTLGECQLKVGGVYELLGEYAKALELYRKALGIFTAIQVRTSEANALYHLGRGLRLTGNLAAAREALTPAWEIRHKALAKEDEADVLFELAQLESTGGNLHLAAERISAALDLIEFIRSHVTSQDLRVSYFAKVRSFYDFYLETLMQLHRLEPQAGHHLTALQVAERSRARTLLEMLNESRVDLRNGADPEILKQERAIRQRLAAKGEYLTKLLAEGRQGEELTLTRKEFDSLTDQFKEIQTLIRLNSPGYASLTQPVPLTVKAIQSDIVGPETVLVEYVLGARHSYAWVVSGSEVTTCELPSRETIETAVRNLYQTLSAKPAGAEAGATYREASRALSRMILAPLADQIQGKRLLIVPDGALQYIPFSVLASPLPKGQSSTGKTGEPFVPLVAEYEIDTLPSASSLDVLRKEIATRTPPDKTLALLADPVFSAADPRVKRGGKAAPLAPPEPTLTEQTAANRNLTKVRPALPSGKGDPERFEIPRLYFTRKEASTIAALVPQDSMQQALDFAATREALFNPELGRYRMLHIATHGFVNAERPELSGLIFSLVNEQGTPKDGFLLSTDLYNLNLRAELVVLSACETGLGKDIKGEGLVGMTRGFMYAGAQRVVVSLWSVSDRATAELMGLFYKGMFKDNLRPIAALRQAQVQLAKSREWSHPYYWAGFQMQGEWR